ncbi:MAG: OmpA family protein [Lachnospiraceae bacterium]|nr:OmpA family protein [Lachnospiraceae bacterium]
MTLLLAVFIVLFAVSNVDKAKVEKMSGAFKEIMMTGGAGIFSGDSKDVGIFPDGGYPNINSKNYSQENAQTKNEATTDKDVQEFLGANEMKDMEALKAEIDSELQSENVASSVTTSIDMRGLVISFNNAVLFDSGNAKVKEENEKALLEVAAMVNTTDNYIRIEGHTDDIPINSKIYASNWELSTARASSVVRLLIDKGNVSPERLSAVGYGEYKPVESNATPEGRAKNRRIDFIVMSEKYNNLEKQN